MKTQDWMDTLDQHDIWIAPQDARVILHILANQIKPELLTAGGAKVLNNLVKELEKVADES